MKINKGMSVLLASMLVGGMLVGCGHNNTDTTKAITKSVKEVTKDKTEVKATKDNKESSKKQVNTKKEKPKEEPKKKNTNTKKDTKEKPVYDEYGYDQYGNYDPNKDLYNDREWDDEDHKRWEEIHGDDIEDEDYSEQEASDVYWCSECQCFSTYKHNHPIQEPDNSDYDEDYEEYDTEDYDDEPSDTYEIENYNEEEE